MLLEECRGEAVPDEMALTKCSWLGCENSLGPNTEWEGNLNFANGKISLLWSYLLFCKLFSVVGLCMWALDIFLIFILCVWVIHCMYVGAPCVCLVPRRSEEGGFPETGVTAPCGCWKLNWNFCKSGNCSWLLSHLSSPRHSYFCYYFKSLSTFSKVNEVTMLQQEKETRNKEGMGRLAEEDAACSSCHSRLQGRFQ